MGVKKFRQKLIKAEKCGFDSMLFIYLFEQNVRYFPLVKQAFSLAERGKIKIVTSAISLIEILSSASLEKNPEKIRLYLEFFKNMKNLSVIDTNWAIIEKSSQMRRKFGLRTPDAIQLATSKTNSANLFVTNDKIFKKTKDADIIFLTDYINTP